jgi:hypothetical protein
MKWYWLKIIGGALIIFCLGFAGITAVRAAKHRVTEVTHSNSDISIPLAFVPFTFDGAKNGTFRRVVFHRSNPHQLNSVDLVVKLSDPSLAKQFEHCELTVDNPTQINSNTSFRCAGADSGLEEFGRVTIETGAESAEADEIHVPLMIPKKVVADLRGEGSGAAEKMQADRFQQLTDSMKSLGLSMAAAVNDSVRDAIREQMDDVRSELDDARDAMVEAAQARAEATVRAKMNAYSRRDAKRAERKAHSNPE